MTRSLIILLLFGSFSLQISAATLQENCRELFQKGLLAQAEAQCRQAATAGDGESAFWLSNIYTLGLPGAAPDLEQAIDWLNRSAQANYGPACFNLASLYERGEVFEPSAPTAFHWYQRGAEAGHIPSQTQTGIAYLKGKGTASDFDKSRLWLTKAAEAGDQSAQVTLAILVRSLEPALSLYWYQKAAQQGNSFAFHELAEIYADGLLGQEKDLNRAIAYAKESVRLGRVSSGFLLDQLRLQKQQSGDRSAPAVANLPPKPVLPKPVLSKPVLSQPVAPSVLATPAAMSAKTPDTTTAPETAPVHGLKDEAWLMAQPSERYVLQLIQLSRQAAVDNFIQRYNLRDKVVFFQAHTGAGDVYVVIYGETATDAQAARALARQLPAALRKDIWYRRFGAIKQSYVPVSPR